MKKTFLKSCVALLAGLFLATGAKAVDEGIDYRTLSQAVPTETGDKIEVLELFWYGCPHCYHLEPALKKWLAGKADYVEFRRGPAVLGQNWVSHARAYFAAELLGVLDDLHEPFFQALHDKKMRLFDEQSITNWFKEKGVDAEEFRKAYRSFIVDMKVRRASQLGNRLGLDGVPSFVVNGKYVTSPSQAGGSERMFEVLTHLAAMEAGALPKQEPEPESPAETAPPAVQPVAEVPAEVSAGAEQAAVDAATEAAKAASGEVAAAIPSSE